MEKLNRNKFLKYLIYLILLPFTLTYFILKKDNYSVKKKFILISIVWVFYLIIVFNNNNSSKYKSDISVKPTTTIIQQNPPKKVEADNISNTPQVSIKPSETPTIISTSIPKQTDSVTLVKVIDGDTIEVNINGKNERIRYIGIDTPEMDDNRPDIKCFAEEAKSRNAELLNASFTLESDSSQTDRDKYNRLLRYVILNDGSNVSEILIEEGHGYEYTYDIPYKYQSEFKNAQKSAENELSGLWDPTHSCYDKKQSTQEPVTNNSQSNTQNNQPAQGSSYTCGAKRYCTQMATCDEAYFYYNNCGLTRLDGDKDGVPCETLCR